MGETRELDSTLSTQDLIGTEEACALLQMSRPTFIKKKNSWKLASHSRGRKLFFSKPQIVFKILAKDPCRIPPTDLLIESLNTSDSLEIQPNGHVYDLRALANLDAFGVIILLEKFHAALKDGRPVYAVSDNAEATQFLIESRFFVELKRLFPKSFHQTEVSEKKINSNESLLLPLQFVGIRGQERRISEELSSTLAKRGFSNSLANYLSWIIGELADNSHTHAKGPCHIMVFCRKDSEPSICLAVGDTGMGIQNSLRQNSKYRDLSDDQALLMAFRSKVSGWENVERGKGLSDILSIVAGNHGLIRVDSSDSSLLFDFRNQEKQMTKLLRIKNQPGIQMGIVLYDKPFEKLTRAETDEIIERFLKNVQ